jgi:ubiquitin carboxyl-terminal hydrolase L3
MSIQESEKDYWVPLESNPEVMTDFMHRLGVKKTWQFHDCFGLDEELLAMVPQPCLAVLLLFPYDKLKSEKQKEREKIEKEGQDISPKVYYMKQLVGNACGTVAVMHSLLNNLNKIETESDKNAIENFYIATLEKNYVERGQALGRDTNIHKAHNVVASKGQTEAPEADADVEHHFICFVEVDGHLYELDGAKQFPVNHGKTENLLVDAAGIIKTNFIEKTDGDMGFSVITLGPSESD